LAGGAQFHELEGVFVGFLAAFVTAAGGGHHLVGLGFGQVFPVEGFAKEGRIFGVGHRFLGLCELRSRRRAGRHKFSKMLDFRPGVRYFGVVCGLRAHK
jgi:hypothetical protein